MNLVRALIQKPVVGGKVTIPAAGTRKLPQATIPLCKYSGTKEEKTWSNPFGGFKKKKKVPCDNEENSPQFCEREFHCWYLDSKSSPYGTNRKVLNYTFDLLFTHCLDNACFPGVGSGWTGTRSYSSSPFKSNLKILICCLSGLSSIYFLLPPTLRRPLFLVVIREMRRIPSNSHFIQAGTLSTCRVFKGEPGHTDIRFVFKWE